MKVDRLSLQPDFAFGRREVAGNDLDEGRLAGAVVAHKADNLSAFQGKIDADQRLDGAEAHRNPLHLQQRHLRAPPGRLFISLTLPYSHPQ